MKYRILLSIFLLSAGVSATRAQTQQSTISASPQSSIPAISLGLGATETHRVFDFSVSNSGSTALTILGVQSTANLYVTSFPTSIPANGSAPFGLLFSASANSTGPSEFLHVLTNQGDRVFQFNHDRAQVVQISATSLQWAVGDPLAAKTITLTIAGNQAVIAGVTTSGTGNNASVQPGSGGQYTISVTPGSTSGANRFIVAVALNPTLPGVVPNILCSVGSQ